MKKLFSPLLLALLFLLPLTVQAEEETLDASASGYGDSPQAAITHGLLEAARQNLGVGISLDPDFRRHVHEWVTSSTEGVSTIAERQYSAPEPRERILAPVKGYEVLSLEEVQEGLWQAQIRAQLLRYQAIDDELAQLPSIAVAKFRTPQDEYNVGREISGDRLARNLQQELVNSLSDSRRVRVLDRDFDEEVTEELQTTASSLSPAEQLRQGQEVGADLLLVGEVDQFELGGEEREVYGIQMSTLDPTIRISYRLMEPATREILRSATYVYREEGAYLRDRLNDAGIRAGQEPERIGEVLYPEVARPMTQEILETLHPMRILAMDGNDSVWVSRGRGTLEEGTLLSVHERGQRVQDPDTDLVLRLESDVRATLRVTKVERNYARAEFLHGDRDALEEHATLRVAARPPKEDEPTPGERPISPGSSEEPMDFGQ